MIEDDDVDIDEFLATIHGNKPPYICPFQKCGKILRSYIAIQRHLETCHKQQQELEICEIDIVNDENKNPFNIDDRTQLKRTSKIVTETVQLSYADSKKFVTLQNDRKSFRCNINLPMSIEMTEIDDGTQDLLNMTINTESSAANASFNMSMTEENSNDTPQSDMSAVIQSQQQKRKSIKRKRLFFSRSFRKVRKLNNDTSQLSLTDSGKDNQTGDSKRLMIPNPVFCDDEHFIEFTKQLPNSSEGYVHFVEKSAEELNEMVEYDLDEEDLIWLPMCNEYMSSLSGSPIKKSQKKSICSPTKNQRKSSSSASSSSLQTRCTGIIDKSVMEYVMDRFEKECHFESSNQKIDEDAVCDICLDGSCENSNAILFCDVCNLAVHQECYGVPFVPEGQWLCRKCLHSPSQPVDCCLCPNKGGAFKQTTDNRWAHVVCALWIPEVRFANLIFLEPIEDIEKIEMARLRLTCYLCKQKNVGACIQCHKSNCYTAFHVTCAQHAGLYMLIEHKDHGKNQGTGVRKTTYCDVHSPSDYVRGVSRAMYANTDEDSQNLEKSETRQKHLKDVRKLLSQRQNFTPPVCFPIITPDKLNVIAESIDVPHKNLFMERIHAYWKLKREIKRGVPLLRRLVASSKSNFSTLPFDEDNVEMRSSLKFWQQLRQDLERARLLSELSRKREKIKRELFKNFVSIHRLLIKPASVIMDSLLNWLQALDKTKIFAQPVTDAIAPNYSVIIRNPMDFSMMRQKLTSGFNYTSVCQLRRDFDLMISNCQTYNAKNTVFYNASVRLHNESQQIFESFERHYEEVGLDQSTGFFQNQNIYNLIQWFDESPDDVVCKLEKELNKKNAVMRKPPPLLLPVAATSGGTSSSDCTKPASTVASASSTSGNSRTVSHNKSSTRSSSNKYFPATPTATPTTLSLRPRRTKEITTLKEESTYPIRTRRCSFDSGRNAHDSCSSHRNEDDDEEDSNSVDNNGLYQLRLRRMPATSTSGGPLLQQQTSSSSSCDVTTNASSSTNSSKNNNHMRPNPTISNGPAAPANLVSTSQHTDPDSSTGMTLRNSQIPLHITEPKKRCRKPKSSQCYFSASQHNRNRLKFPRSCSQRSAATSAAMAARKRLDNGSISLCSSSSISVYSQEPSSSEHQLDGLQQQQVFQLNSVVWAKCKNGAWFPGLIVHPSGHCDTRGQLLTEEPSQCRSNSSSGDGDLVTTSSAKVDNTEHRHQTTASVGEPEKLQVHFVLLFDKRRSCQSIQIHKLESLGVSKQTDMDMLQSMGRFKRNAAIQKAYREAVRYLCTSFNEDYPYESDDSKCEVTNPYLKPDFRSNHS